MYFCKFSAWEVEVVLMDVVGIGFVAFTTIGYGDYSPQTPAGRSVFVVWAIMGVGTMTILISGSLSFFLDTTMDLLVIWVCLVVQEAYDSKYKNALHMGKFDKAVKRYRQKTETTRTPPGRRRHRLRAEAAARQGIPPGSSSHSSLARTLSQKPSIINENLDPNEQNSNEVTARTQESLEALPGHVLHQCKNFHKYIKFFVDGGNILDAEDSHHGHGPNGGTSGSSEVSHGLRKLLDEIAGNNGGIGKVTKDEILGDEDARHVSPFIS